MDYNKTLYDIGIVAIGYWVIFGMYGLGKLWDGRDKKG